MEKFRYILKEKQLAFDDVNERNRINELIIKKVIVKRTMQLKRQKFILRMSFNLCIVLIIGFIIYQLKNQFNQYFIEGIHLSTFLMIIGAILIFNLIQNLILILKLNKG